MQLRAQGATEYLVLLAVVLIVALVSVALLGFFPGMASDAQMTQSKAYWSSASPIAIIETDATLATTNGRTYPYLAITNVGNYPIRLVGIVGGDGVTASEFYTDTTAGCSPATAGQYNMSTYLYMAPGEKIIFSTPGVHGGSYCRRAIFFQTAATSTNYVGGAKSVCQNSSSSPGTVVFSSFGFEYVEYIDGQQITKRQIGAKPFIVKCREPTVW